MKKRDKTKMKPTTMDAALESEESDAEAKADVSKRKRGRKKKVVEAVNKSDNLWNSFHCRKCSFRTSTYKALKTHQDTKHKAKAVKALASVAQGEFFCKVCEVSLRSRYEYEKHVDSSKHVKKLYSQPKAPPKPVQPPKVKEPAETTTKTVKPPSETGKSVKPPSETAKSLKQKSLEKRDRPKRTKAQPKYNFDEEEEEELESVTKKRKPREDKGKKRGRRVKSTDTCNTEGSVPSSNSSSPSKKYAIHDRLRKFFANISESDSEGSGSFLWTGSSGSPLAPGTPTPGPEPPEEEYVNRGKPQVYIDRDMDTGSRVVPEEPRKLPPQISSLPVSIKLPKGGLPSKTDSPPQESKSLPSALKLLPQGKVELRLPIGTLTYLSDVKKEEPDIKGEPYDSDRKSPGDVKPNTKDFPTVKIPKDCENLKSCSVVIKREDTCSVLPVKLSSSRQSSVTGETDMEQGIFSADSSSSIAGTGSTDYYVKEERISQIKQSLVAETESFLISAPESNQQLSPVKQVEAISQSHQGVIRTPQQPSMQYQSYAEPSSQLAASGGWNTDYATPSLESNKLGMTDYTEKSFGSLKVISGPYNRQYSSQNLGEDLPAPIESDNDSLNSYSDALNKPKSPYASQSHSQMQYPNQGMGFSGPSSGQYLGQGLAGPIQNPTVTQVSPTPITCQWNTSPISNQVYSPSYSDRRNSYGSASQMDMQTNYAAQSSQQQGMYSAYPENNSSAQNQMYNVTKGSPVGGSNYASGYPYSSPVTNSYCSSQGTVTSQYMTMTTTVCQMNTQSILSSSQGYYPNNQHKPMYDPNTGQVDPGFGSSTGQYNSGMTANTGQYNSGMSSNTGYYQSLMAQNTGQMNAVLGPNTGQMNPGLGSNTGQMNPGLGSNTGQMNPGLGSNTGQLNSSFGSNTGQMNSGLVSNTGQLNSGFVSNTGQMNSGFGSNTGQMNSGLGSNTGDVNSGFRANTGQISSDLGSNTGQMYAGYGSNVAQQSVGTPSYQDRLKPGVDAGIGQSQVESATKQSNYGLTNQTEQLNSGRTSNMGQNPGTNMNTGQLNYGPPSNNAGQLNSNMASNLAQMKTVGSTNTELNSGMASNIGQLNYGMATNTGQVDTAMSSNRGQINIAPNYEQMDTGLASNAKPLSIQPDLVKNESTSILHSIPMTQAQVLTIGVTPTISTPSYSAPSSRSSMTNVSSSFTMSNQAPSQFQHQQKLATSTQNVNQAPNRFQRQQKLAESTPSVNQAQNQFQHQSNLSASTQNVNQVPNQLQQKLATSSQSALNQSVTNQWTPPHPPAIDHNQQAYPNQNPGRVQRYNTNSPGSGYSFGSGGSGHSSPIAQRMPGMRANAPRASSTRGGRGRGRGMAAPRQNFRNTAPNPLPDVILVNSPPKEQSQKSAPKPAPPVNQKASAKDVVDLCEPENVINLCEESGKSKKSVNKSLDVIVVDADIPDMPAKKPRRSINRSSSEPAPRPPANTVQGRRRQSAIQRAPMSHPNPRPMQNTRPAIMNNPRMQQPQQQWNQMNMPRQRMPRVRNPRNNSPNRFQGNMQQFPRNVSPARFPGSSGRGRGRGRGRPSLMQQRFANNPPASGTTLVQPSQRSVQSDSFMAPLSLDQVSSQDLLDELMTRRNLFMCMCGVGFQSKALFEKHEKVHSPWSPLSCAVCQRGFKDRTTFHWHLAKH